MKKLAVIDFRAELEVSKGNKVPVNQLFSPVDLRQEFDLLDDVEDDKTRIQVDIEKCRPFKTKADSTRKKGDKTGWWLLLQRDDFTRKLVADSDIQKGDKLQVVLEKM
jgi:hypothetical protein